MSGPHPGLALRMRDAGRRRRGGPPGRSPAPPPSRRTRRSAPPPSAIPATPPAILEANRADLAAAGGAGADRRLPRPARARRGAARRHRRAPSARWPRCPTRWGEVTASWSRPNGLSVKKVRIPLGVVLMVYEARPNVTVEAAALCVKSGNACILRPGSDALASSLALGAAFAEGLEAAGLPAAAAQVVPVADREATFELLALDDLIDLAIPRGGPGLIRAVAERSRVPVVKHYQGVCHLFLDETRRRGRGGGHRGERQGAAPRRLQRHRVPARPPRRRRAAAARGGAGARRRGGSSCAATPPRSPSSPAPACPACRPPRRTTARSSSTRSWPSAWWRDLDGALDHIARHGSLHTEAILTNDLGRRPPLRAGGGGQRRDGQRIHPLQRRRRARARRRDRHQHHQAARVRPHGARGAHHAEVRGRGARKRPHAKRGIARMAKATKGRKPAKAKGGAAKKGFAKRRGAEGRSRPARARGPGRSSSSERPPGRPQGRKVAPAAKGARPGLKRAALRPGTKVPSRKAPAPGGPGLRARRGQRSSRPTTGSCGPSPRWRPAPTRSPRTRWSSTCAASPAWPTTSCSSPPTATARRRPWPTRSTTGSPGWARSGSAPRGAAAAAGCSSTSATWWSTSCRPRRAASTIWKGSGPTRRGCLRG